YVGPLREIPDRYHGESHRGFWRIQLAPVRNDPPGSVIQDFVHHYRSPADEARWATGIAAWDAMVVIGNNLINEVNRWLAKLKTNYYLRICSYREIESDHAQWEYFSKPDDLKL